MAPRWTEEMNIKFLELYRDRPCLWDQLSVHYKNKHFREIALREIVSSMNIDGFGITETKSKIKALRATYIGEMIKIEKSAKLGCDTYLYVPNLKWLHIMKYIMEIGTLKRETMSSLEDQMVKRKATIKLENKESSTPDEFEIYDDAESASKEVDSTEDNDSGTCENQDLQAKRMKGRSKIQQIANTAQELKSLSALIKSIPESEHDVYGKHVAAQLKKLSTRQAIIAMHKVNSILTECRLADIESQETQSPDFDASDALFVSYDDRE